MKNSIGDVIKDEIATIVDMYNKIIRERCQNYPDLKEEYKNKRMRFRYIYENVGDDFFKRMLTNMVNEISKAVKQ